MYVTYIHDAIHGVVDGQEWRQRGILQEVDFVFSIFVVDRMWVAPGQFSFPILQWEAEDQTSYLQYRHDGCGVGVIYRRFGCSWCTFTLTLPHKNFTTMFFFHLSCLAAVLFLLFVLWLKFTLQTFSSSRAILTPTHPTLSSTDQHYCRLKISYTIFHNQFQFNTATCSSHFNYLN